MKRRLCLLGDFDRHIWLDSSLTVSRYETTGSDFLIGIQAWSSSRSFKQISRWSSPAPAMICSPDSSIIHWTIGSDFARRFNPTIKRMNIICSETKMLLFFGELTRNYQNKNQSVITVQTGAVIKFIIKKREKTKTTLINIHKKNCNAGFSFLD